jgi:uncharacterized membrane protein
MNRMLMVMFDDARSAEAGTHVLKALHDEGEITLYALGVIARDAAGRIRIAKAVDPTSIGAGIGLAVGGFVGMLGGPLSSTSGPAVGASTGGVVGAVRGYWAAGVGLDFAQEADGRLRPGKVAVIAEVEEDWVALVDISMEAIGGIVYRRARADVEAAALDHDIASLRADVAALEREFQHGAGEAKKRLHRKVNAARASLDSALERARQAIDAQRHEAAGKLHHLEAPFTRARGRADGALDRRIKRLRASFAERTETLEQAWGLTTHSASV